MTEHVFSDQSWSEIVLSKSKKTEAAFVDSLLQSFPHVASTFSPKELISQYVNFKRCQMINLPGVPT